MAVEFFTALNLSATIVSLIDVLRTLAYERCERKDLRDTDLLVPGLNRLSTSLFDFDLCFVENIHDSQHLESREFEASQQRVSHCQTWGRFHALLKALDNTLPTWVPTCSDAAATSLINRKQTDKIQPHWYPIPRTRLESRKLILVTQLSEAPRVIKAITGKSFLEIPGFERQITAIVVLDNVSLRNGVESDGMLDVRLMNDLHAIERTFITSLQVQNQEPQFRAAVVTAFQSMAEQPTCGTFGNFMTRFAFSHTTIQQCSIAQMFDCTLWSIWQIADDGFGAIYNADLNLSRLSLHSLDLSYGNLLKDLVHGKSYAEVCVILEACQWVAGSFRTLYASELLEALTLGDSTLSSRAAVNMSRQRVPVINIMSLCADVLSVEEDETVQFRDEGMRSFILLSGHSILQGLPCAHEMIAKTCLVHLSRSNPATIFRQWVNFEHYLIDGYSSYGLGSYAIAYWHRHYCLAEADSQHLHALLHYIIIKIYPVNTETNISDAGCHSRRNNFALEVCIAHGFKALGNKLISMGANVNSIGFMTREPLLFMAVARSPHMVELLLQAGADVHRRDLDGVTALHIAAASGNSSLTSILLDHGMRSNNSRPGTACRECKEVMSQLLFVAVHCRHIGTVNCLLQAGADIKILCDSTKTITGLHSLLGLTTTSKPHFRYAYPLHSVIAQSSILTAAQGYEELSADKSNFNDHRLLDAHSLRKSEPPSCPPRGWIWINDKDLN